MSNEKMVLENGQDDELLRIEVDLPNRKKEIITEQIDYLFKKIQLSSLGKLPLCYLFPLSIWSKIFFLAPRESFALCEEFHLPYHYIYAIDISRRDLTEPENVIKLQKYKKLRYLKSDYMIFLRGLSSNLQTLVLKNFLGSTYLLRRCLNLQVIKISYPVNSLQFLKTCINLRT